MCWPTGPASQGWTSARGGVSGAPDVALPWPGHQRPHDRDESAPGQDVQRPRTEHVEQRSSGGFPVDKAVIRSGKTVEREGDGRPYHCGGDREPIAAPVRPHATAPSEIDGCPHHEQVNAPEGQELKAREVGAVERRRDKCL